ncbi:putative molybdenum carrier protein [Pseudomonas aeruginosa]|nr:putative molybdenum carrier protein [Pseudomonas aeruginosa]
MIISGGQTGVDRAALDFAIARQIRKRLANTPP